MIEYFYPNIDDYNLIYEKYPDNQQEILEYLMKELKIDPEEYQKEVSRIQDISWEEREVTFFLIPKGAPRPRSGNWNHVYVKGAKELKRVFQRFLHMEGIICTRTEFDLECYLPTPITGMTNMEIALAEGKEIRPLVMPDYDNLGKNYTDALQGVLLLNDNIICDGRIKQY